MEAYKYLAAVYDGCMYDVDYSEWYEYIRSLTGSVPGEVLEMACGTGNITQFLARDYDVIATDLSEEMLDIARGKAKARFAVADMNDFRRDRKCSAVISAMDGVNYLTDGPDGFFECAYHNLENGGKLLFDISSEYKLRKLICEDMFFDDSDDYTYLWTNELKGSLLYMNLSVFIKDGEVYRRFDEQHVQRAYTEKEITESLKKAGFRDIRAYDFLTENSPAETSERIQFVAVR